MTAREQISHVDTAWLRMDRPENLLQIVGAPGLGGSADRHGRAGDASDGGDFFWQLV